VTVIVHNAWRLDFNLALASFEPAIRGTRNLLDLAMKSAHAAHIRMAFTSSVAVTQSWPRDAGPFPEEPQDNPQWCVGNGYGESKYVCEQVR
jgi:nucleoside-diphosphate-sugar epimerase